MIRVGCCLLASARRLEGDVHLNLEPTVSTITGFAADAPIVTRSEVTAQTVVGAGEWIVVFGLSTIIASYSTTGLPRWLSRNSAAGLWIFYLI